MTPERIAEIRALLDAAIPWDAGSYEPLNIAAPTIIAELLAEIERFQREASVA